MPIGDRLRTHLVYAIRSCVVTAALAFVCGRFLAGRLRGIDVVAALNYFASLDIYRAAFYGLLPGLFAVLFLPAATRKALPWSVRIPAAAVLGLAAAWIPVLAVGASRNGAFMPRGFELACAWLGLNAGVTVLLIGGAASGPSGFVRFLRKAFPVADVILPLPVFASYRCETGRGFFAWRAVPLLVLLLPAATVLLANPAPRYGAEILPNGTQILVRNLNKYVIQTNESGDVLWVADYFSVERFNPVAGRSASSRRTVNAGGINRFAMDPAQEHVVAAGFAKGEFHYAKFDARTMVAEEEKSSRLPDYGLSGGTITLWDADRNIVTCVFECGMAQFRPDGEALAVLPCNRPVWMTDAALDIKRGRFYVVAGRVNVIASYDAETLELKKMIRVPSMGQRMALDKAGGRLFVTFPLEGIIRAVDLNSFEIIREIPSVLGVRSVEFDESHGRLLAGGFSPYLEVFRAGDLALLDRVASLPWQRSIATASGAPIAYISTADGLAKMDLGVLRDGALRRVLLRSDPFFALARLAARPVVHFLGDAIGETYDPEGLKSQRPIRVLIMNADSN